MERRANRENNKYIYYLLIQALVQLNKKYA